MVALLGGMAEAIFQQLRLGMRDSQEDPRDAVIRQLQEYLREAEQALATSEELRRVEVEHVERVSLMERLEEQQDMRRAAAAPSGADAANPGDEDNIPL